MFPFHTDTVWHPDHQTGLFVRAAPPVFSSDIGMQRQPLEKEDEAAEEGWTVRWEERLGCDERLRAVSQSGRLAQRQQIPFPCQSALSLSESDLTFTGWWLQRPETAFCLKPDTHTLIRYRNGKNIPPLVDRARAFTHARSSRSKRACEIFKQRAGGKLSSMIYCKGAILTTEMRPDRLESQHSMQMALFFISLLMRSHFVRSVELFPLLFTIWVCPENNTNRFHFHKTNNKTNELRGEEDVKLSLYCHGKKKFHSCLIWLFYISG